jgi:ABC-2 type transport system ATP-binding protein
MTAIVTAGLGRSFGGHGSGGRTALTDVNLTVEHGEIRGILGPNGAGKTTLCKILSTVLLPTTGSAAICGYDLVSQQREVQQLIGIVFGGERGLYGRLTAVQNLRYWGALYGLRGRELRHRTVAVLERVGLTGHAGRRVDTFSRGMKQRLHLARGLVANPTVLLLDEPTVGMDPIAARDFRDLVTDLRGESKTILLTTHDMAEAEALCDQVTLIDTGKILTTDTPRAVAALLGRHQHVEAHDVPAPADEQLMGLAGVVGVARRPNGDLYIEVESTAATRLVVDRLLALGVTELSSGPPRLEDAYVQLFRREGMVVPE